MHRLTQPFAASARRRIFALIVFVLVLMGPSIAGISTAAAQTIPADAKATCTVTSAQFNGWFKTTPVAANGIVNPANSVTFPNSPNCSFYQWSKQMFLWLTSPAPPTYGGGSVRVMDSPVFYDVSPGDSTGARTLIPHTAGVLRKFAVRAAQPGPHGLPIVVDIHNNIFEVKEAAPTAKPMVKNSIGKLVPLATISRSPTHTLVLQDSLGKVIAPAQRPVAALKLTERPSLVATRFHIGGGIIFIDSTGNVIETEEGQAETDGTLIAQNGSLVYYVTMVNDVYAYFATMVAHQPAGSKTQQFPTTQAGLNAVVAFAAAHNKTFPDANALAIEVKSAWVVASSLPAGNYITMEATIPKYNTSNNQTWTSTGVTENVTLALVGMHVVGSTLGHPEMIWSTFEHFGNTPNAAYSYVNTANVTKPVASDTSGSWLFCKTGSHGPFNQMLAVAHNPPTITANQVTGFPLAIAPSDTMRMMPWGAASNASPNPLDATAAASNTELISIHNSVKNLMPAGDIRSNYYMTGSTWTIGGFGSTGSFGNPGNNTTSNGTAVGTSQIGNSTMETYTLGTTQTWAQFGSNCLTCHTTNTTGVSHDFAAIKPLF